MSLFFAAASKSNSALTRGDAFDASRAFQHVQAAAAEAPVGHARYHSIAGGLVAHEADVAARARQCRLVGTDEKQRSTAHEFNTNVSKAGKRLAPPPASLPTELHADLRERQTGSHRTDVVQARARAAVIQECLQAAAESALYRPPVSPIVPTLKDDDA